MSKILHLTLKKKWFDMIASGVKKEEYREIKPYWADRLVRHREEMERQGYEEFIEDLKQPERRHRHIYDLLNYFRAEFTQFDTISATNGYGKHRPNIKWKHKGIRIGTPNPEWCEPEDIGKTVFILEIGELI